MVEEAHNCCMEHSGMVKEIKTLKIETEKQWTAIDRLRNRPPIWATAVIALLTGLLGASVTYAGLATKLAQLAAK